MKILTNSLVYLGATLLNQFLGFLVLPVMTHFLSPSELGHTALFSSLVAFLIPVVGMSMGTHVARNYYKKPPAEMAKIGYNVVVAILANFAVVLLIAVITWRWQEWVHGVTGPWVLAAVLVALGASFTNQLQAVYRTSARAVSYALVSVGSATLVMGLSLLLVAGWHWGWKGRNAGYAVAVTMVGAVSLASLLRQHAGNRVMEWGLIRGLYRISLPLVPHALAAQVNALGSRFILDRLMSKEAVGLYSLGHTFGSMVILPVEAFTNAWTPWVYQKLARQTGDDDVRIVRMIYAASGGILVLWVSLSVAVPVAVRTLLPDSYHPSALLSPWVGLAFAFQGIYTLLVPLLVDQGKTDFLAVITMTTAALSLGAGWALVDGFGVTGAAVAAIISSAVKLVLVFLYAQRIRPLPWLDAMRMAA